MSRYTRSDRTRDILKYEPRLGAIENEIKAGTFEGDPRQLKRRMHHLIGWFAEDPKLRLRIDYDAVWFHFLSLLKQYKPGRNRTCQTE